MIVAALLLAAAPQPAATPGWLVGAWVPVSEASRQDGDACTGEDMRVWRGDGSFADAGSEGDWRLNGGRLTEFGQNGDAPQVSRVARLGPNRMRLTDADGEQIDWRRCPR